MSIVTESIYRCCSTAELLIPPRLVEFWNDRAKSYGPGMAGALFGGGWAFFFDSVATSDHKIPFVQFLPGIIATLALIMINCIRRDEMLEDDSYNYDEGVYCRARSWLFLSYCISFGAVVGAVWVLLHDIQQSSDSGPSAWPGVAGLFQVALILGSALLFFVSRTPSESSTSYSYGDF